MAKCFLFISSVTGFLSVALGAFGAHALKSRFNEYQMSLFHTAFQYQFFHALALGILGCWCLRADGSQAQTLFLKLAGYAFIFGTVIFSGSLYLLAWTQIKWLGAITPIGGVGFLIGWALMAVAAIK